MAIATAHVLSVMCVFFLQIAKLEKESKDADRNDTSVEEIEGRLRKAKVQCDPVIVGPV